MHNAYCDADENSLDLRIHPKQHTTCASVRGKRSRSYNYGYVVLVHHHRQRQQAPWAPEAVLDTLFKSTYLVSPSTLYALVSAPN